MTFIRKILCNPKECGTPGNTVLAFPVSVLLIAELMIMLWLFQNWLVTSARVGPYPRMLTKVIATSTE